MGRTSTLIQELKSGQYTVKPLSASSGQSRTAQVANELRSGQYQVKNLDGTAAKPVSDKTGTAASPGKGKQDAASALMIRAEGIPSARPSTAGLQNQLRQAQADLDTDAILRLNRQLKEERARRGQQTAGDRVSDVFSAALGGSGGSLANLAGFASNLAMDPETDRRQIARLQNSLQTGRTTDGKPITDAQRKTIQDSIARLSARAEKRESPDSFTNRTYRAADLDEQLLYGSAQAAKEYVTEKLFGLAVPQRMLGQAGAGSLDDAIETGIRKVTERLAKTPGGQKAVGGLLTWLAGGATEGLEEGIGSLIENTLINPNLRDWDPDTRTREQKFEDGLYDMLVGGVSGLMGVTNLAQYQVSPRSGTDAHVRGTLDLMNRTAGRETAQEAPGARLDAEAGTDTPAAQSVARTAQTGPAVNENGLTALSQLERENLSSGKRNKVVSTFSEAVNFVKNALRNRQTVDRAYLGKVPDSVAEAVLSDTGVDIRGYGAIINGNDVRHIIRNHGDPMMETARGQVAVTPEDIAKIPEILSSPDKVYLSASLDGKGRKALVFEKQIGDRLITLQGVSDGKKALQTDTLYIQQGRARTTRDTMPGVQGDTVPVINAQSEPPQSSSIDFTIPQGAENVNPGVMEQEIQRLFGGGKRLSPDALTAEQMSAAEAANEQGVVNMEEAAPEAGPVRAGRATTIKRPYQGTVPVQVQKNTAPVQVAEASVQTAQNRIEGARHLEADPMSAGQGFKSLLKQNLRKFFQAPQSVTVDGVTFNKMPYQVEINRNVVGKVVNDQNLTAEKLALLDILPEIVRNGEYVGSGQYIPHGSKKKQSVRYDYFETTVEIGGKSFIVSFDVDVEPNVNNYRTHKLIEMDLKEIPSLGTGPAPAAAETFHSGPAEGMRPLNFNDTIAQGAENVNPPGTDGLGAADAGSLNSDYDRLQAQSDTFHPEGPNAARPVDVPTQDFEGRKVSKSASTMMGAKILDNADVASLEQMVADGAFSFDTIHDKDALQKAQNTVRVIGFDRALERYIQAAQANMAAKDNTVLGQVFMLEAARGGNRKALAEICALYARNSTNIAQAMQAQRILRQLGPEARLYALQTSVYELAEKYGVDIELDQTALNDFMNAENEEARQAAEAALVQSAASQLPTTFRAKFDAVRYLAMLGNPRTHIRNILGNIAFQAPAIAKNRVGALAEMGAQALGADVERTKSFFTNPLGDLAREARADWANAKPFLEGGKYSEGKVTAGAIEQEAKPFQNSKYFGWVGTLADKNGSLLELEDNVAKHWIYSQSLAGYLKANGVKHISEASPELLNRARNYAAQEALRNTFNDRNDVSDFVAKLGNIRNSKSKTARAASYLTEGLLPFKRTPANVAVRAVEYSPVGAAVSIMDLLNKGVRGKATAETVTKGLDRLAAGLSGSALMVLGFLASGVVTGGEDEDEDQQRFDDLTGHQTYALELDNGTSITLDWLAPSAIPFFMGVELAHAMQAGGVSWDDAVNMIKNMSEPMLEMSMLQGLNDVFKNAAYAQQHGGSVLGSVVVSAATGYLTQVFPTVFGQAERTAENRRMTTYADENSKVPKDLQYTLGKLSQKVPGWDYNQIPYIDAWGREEEIGDPVERMFNNFFNPAYVSQVQVDQVERELQRVKDATGLSHVFPDRAPAISP